MKIKNLLSVITGLPRKKICLKCQSFTGTMPINFSREYLSAVIKNDYALLEKSDGTRYLFSHQPSRKCLIDRNFSIKNFPHFIFNQKIFENVKGHCFLDGELSVNLILEKFEFLIYDVFCWDNDWRISSWDLRSRINSLKFPEKDKKMMVRIFNFLVKKDIFSKINISGLFNKIWKNKFSIEHIYYNVNRADNIMCNKNDGVILSPIKSIYLIKNPLSVFKWKFENGNTVDFMVKKKPFVRGENQAPKLLTEFFCRNERNQLISIECNKTSSLNFKNFTEKKAESNGKVEEFFFDRETKKWFRLKSRKDKKNPNSNKVVINTLENIAGLFFFNEFIDKLIKKDIRKQRGKPPIIF